MLVPGVPKTGRYFIAPASAPAGEVMYLVVLLAVQHEITRPES